MRKKTKVNPYLAGVAFSLCVGFSFLGIKVSTPYADALQILTIRYDFAMLAILLFVVLGFGKTQMRGKPKWNLILTAAFYVGFMIFQTVGLFFCTSVESAILFAIIPIIVMIIARIFLKEKTKPVQTAFVFISVMALVLLIVMGTQEVTVNMTGIILLIISSVMMALNNTYMRFTRTVYTPFEITTMICMLGGVVFNIVSVVRCAKAGSFAMYVAPLVHPQFVIATAYLGVFCILFSAQLMAYMQANMPAVNASLFGNVSTALSIVVGVVVLGEPLEWYHIVCVTLIVLSCVVINMVSAKDAKKAQLSEGA